MGGIGVGIDRVGDDNGVGQPGHRVDVLLTHAHVDDGGFAMVGVHQVGRTGGCIGKAELPGGLLYVKPYKGPVFRSGNATDKNPVPAQGDGVVVPVGIPHRHSAAEFRHSLRCSQPFQCCRHIPGHKAGRQHGGQGGGAALVGIEVTGHVLPSGPGLLNQGDSLMDALAPVLHATAFEVADLHRAACLSADFQNLPDAGQQAISLAPDVGGENAAILPQRPQHRRKLIGGTVTLRNIHNAAGDPHSASRKGIFNEGGGLFGFLGGVGGVGKALDRDLHRAGSHHGGDVDRQRTALQLPEVFLIDMESQLLTPGPQHRLHEIVHLPGGFRGGYQRHAAVAGDSGRDALCQHHLTEA